MCKTITKLKRYLNLVSVSNNIPPHHAEMCRGMSYGGDQNSLDDCSFKACLSAAYIASQPHAVSDLTWCQWTRHVTVRLKSQPASPESGYLDWASVIGIWQSVCVAHAEESWSILVTDKALLLLSWSQQDCAKPWILKTVERGPVLHDISLIEHNWTGFLYLRDQGPKVQMCVFVWI